MFKKRNKNEKFVCLLEAEMESLREVMRDIKKMKEACYPHRPELVDHYQAQYEIYRLKLHQTEHILDELRALK